MLLLQIHNTRCTLQTYSSTVEILKNWIWNSPTSFSKLNKHLFDIGVPIFNEVMNTVFAELDFCTHTYGGVPVEANIKSWPNVDPDKGRWERSTEDLARWDDKLLWHPEPRPLQNWSHLSPVPRVQVQGCLKQQVSSKSCACPLPLCDDGWGMWMMDRWWWV